MASTARQQRLLAGVIAATFLGLVMQSEARLLVEQQTVDYAKDVVATGSEGSSQHDEAWQQATTSFGFEAFARRPSSWLQQQLVVFEALQQAVIHSLHQHVSMDAMDSESAGPTSQEELLRHVGCARLRAALLNQATQEGRLQLGHAAAHQSLPSSGGSAATASASTQSAASSTKSSIGWIVSSDEEPEEEEEYFGDYMRVTQEQALSSSSAGAFNDAQVESGAKAVESAMRTIGASSSTSQEEADTSDDRMLRLMGPKYMREAAEEQNAALAQLEGGDDSAWGASANVRTSSSAVAAEGRLPQGATGAVGGDHDDDDKEVYEYDAYVDEVEADSADDLPYEYTAGEDVDVDSDLVYDDADVNELYGYEVYDDYEEMIVLADAMLSKFELDTLDAEWADYLDQAYEYFTVYLHDDADIYTDTYDDVDLYVDGAPNAVALLASIAELVVFAQVGAFVMEVRPSYSIVRTFSDGSEGDTESLLVISEGGSYLDPAVAAAVFGGVDPMSDPVWVPQGPALEWLSMEDTRVEVVNRFDTRLVRPDGSVNWELVVLVILAAGTVAMLVGFVVSCVSLRRSMGARLVYAPPQRPCKGDWSDGKGSGKGGKGKGFDAGFRSEYSKPLLGLRPEDCHGAVCWGAGAPLKVEHAAQYVPEQQTNESVAKALAK